MSKGGRNAQQGGETRGVVARAGSEDAVVGLYRICVGAGWKDGIQMSREQDDWSIRGFSRRNFGDDIADRILVSVMKAELLELLKEPQCARLFPERWSRDAEHIEVPPAKLRLMQVQPSEGVVDAALCSELCDAKLGGNRQSSSRLSV